eukprot:9469178-Pyramimonas_sp.AAC.1
MGLGHGRRIVCYSKVLFSTVRSSAHSEPGGECAKSKKANSESYTESEGGEVACRSGRGSQSGNRGQCGEACEGCARAAGGAGEPE